MLPVAPTYARWLALIRFYTGFFWIMHGLGKVRDPQWAAPAGNCATIIGQMIAHTSGPYHDFIANTVLPNVTVFAHLVAWGETLTGVSLLLGLLTRVGGLVGALLALNYWAAKGHFHRPSGYATLDTAAAVLSFIHFVLPTGNAMGLDNLLAPRRRIVAETVEAVPAPVPPAGPR